MHVAVKDEQSFEASVRALAAEGRRDLGPHPAPKDLLDYQAGEGSAAERDRIQEHLSWCPACTRTLLDLESFPDLEPFRPEGRLSDGEVAAEWRRFQERTRAAAVAERRTPLPFFRSPLRRAYALAAVLAVAVAGLALWTLRLRQEVGELSAPRADVYVADLVPLDAARERSEGEEAVQIPSWAGRVLLILSLEADRPYPEYRLEILDSRGGAVWSRSGVQPRPDGNFTLEVPRRFLSGDACRVRLSGRQGAGWIAVAEYEVRIRQDS